jgi:threonine aldolase
MTQVDLRSDTVTKPTPDMLTAMSKAEVGDVDQAIEVMNQVVVNGSI